MAYIIERVPCSVGDIDILVEAAQDEGIAEAGLRGAHEFTGIEEAIEAICTSIGETFGRVAPQEAAVEFSLGCAVKSGKLFAVLLDGGANAAFKVTLTWRRGEPED